MWREAIPQPPNVSGKRLGILGLGTIGQKIAKRAAAFDMEIGYHNRKPREGVAHRYFDSLKALAAWADVLVMRHAGRRGHAAPGRCRGARCAGAAGLSGQHLRAAAWSTPRRWPRRCARAASPARASMSTRASPGAPEPLIGLDNVLLTPHMAGWSPEATQASVDRFMANAEGHFAGRGVVSPI